MVLFNNFGISFELKCSALFNNNNINNTPSNEMEGRGEYRSKLVCRSVGWSVRPSVHMIFGQKLDLGMRYCIQIWSIASSHVDPGYY
jgi:hypothetical protein